MKHIPGIDWDGFGDISFELALEQANLPAEGYDAEKWLFVPNRYEEYRFILGTRGKKPLICIGINPSTAAPDRLDPTLKSVERIAASNGYDSFIMLNVSAQRATDPKTMAGRMNTTLHAQNLEAFKYALSLSADKAVWAAWGNIVMTKPYLIVCACDFITLGKQLGAKWYCCGKISKAGHPHHPLYLKKDEPLVPFDALQYEKIANR